MENYNERGITFIVTNVSDEAKEKLRIMMEKRDEKMRKLVEDYRSTNLLK